MLRAFSLLLVSAIAAGCTPVPEGGPARPVVSAPPLAAQKIAVLLPLSGPNAGLAHDLQQAVQLALGEGGPQADVRDTAGTPTGATAAAQAAIAAGDTVIVGPLTAAETAAVAYVAPATPILAFTSDRNQARPNVWPLGITPQQQAARLVGELAGNGKARIAAILPATPFGDALADGLRDAAARAAGPAPVIRRYGNGRASELDAAMRDLAGNAAPAEGGDAVAAPPPPPFDALMLAEGGAMLQAAVAATQKYGFRPPSVQIMGPANWARDTANLPSLVGAWYAAPDPSTRGAFEQIYTATYGNAPPGLASIAYDAAHLARLAAGSPGSLTKPGGFEGADGPIALRPDGRVVRGLAVLAVEPGESRVIDRAPNSLAGAS